MNKKSLEEVAEMLEPMFQRIDKYMAEHPEKPQELTPAQESFRDRMMDFDPEYDIKRD